MSYYELSPKPSLDQKYTSQAIDEFQTFIEYSPTDSSVQTAEAIIKELNDKLARKEYESARLYYRMEYYRAAIAYYDFVLERYHDSQYADDALLGKAAALYQRFEFDDALATIDAFLFKYGSSELAEDAESLRQEIIAGKEEALRNPKKFAKVSKKG